MGKEGRSIRSDVIIGTVGSLVAAVLILAANHPIFDLPAICRWIVVFAALALFFWLGLPWIIVGLVYLAMCKVGRIETWMRNRLVVGRFPKSHYLRTMLDPKYRGETVYAATAFVVSKHQKGKFLWVKHRTFHRWMPPGGRLIVNELPHEAVVERVFAETGMPKNSLHFLTTFCRVHNSHVTTDEHIEPAPLPFVVQKELLEQRGGIPFHYDLIYVLETDSRVPPQSDDQNPQWLSIEDIETCPLEERPFPNTLGLAKEVMGMLGPEYRP